MIDKLDAFNRLVLPDTVGQSKPLATLLLPPNHVVTDLHCMHGPEV